MIHYLVPGAVDFTVDPKRLSSALSQVSLMDVMSEQQLAGLLREAAVAEVSVFDVVDDVRREVGQGSVLGQERGA